MSTPVSGNSLAAMFKKPPGCWECPTCMVQNGAMHDICPECKTARPDTRTKYADKPVQVCKGFSDWLEIVLLWKSGNRTVQLNVQFYSAWMSTLQDQTISCLL